MSEIFETAIVQKRNVLNELRAKSFSLQELRFFSIYLSKINPRNIETRVVKFPLSDYQDIMNLGRLNIQQLKASTDSLLGKVVSIPTDTGGYKSFQLFKECNVDKDSNGDWYVSINAHDSALPLMFDFKDRYFKYELWNALQLNSSIQIRMYEILKQYENIGKRELSFQELRDLHGIEPKKYSRLERFKAQVLDVCQKSLKEKTDICFTYERGKIGKSGKWLTIIFYIEKNKSYKRQLQLDGFLDLSDTQFIEASAKEQEEEEVEYGTPLATFLGNCALGNEFSREQVRVLLDLVLQLFPLKEELEMCDYLSRQVNKMNVYSPKQEKRFTYLCKMIEADIAENK